MTVQPILADSSALIGLAACNEEYADMVFSEIAVSTTWTCFREIRNKARNGGSHWLQKSAERILDYVEDGEIAYPTRVNIPGAPNSGVPDAGEKSVRIALGQYEEISSILLFDRGAAVLLERTQQELAGTPNEFTIEPPNFPLYILTCRDSDKQNMSKDTFCDQSEKILQRMDWKGSRQENLFWEFPINC